jgi:hypothetical protein
MSLETTTAEVFPTPIRMLRFGSYMCLSDEMGSIQDPILSDASGICKWNKGVRPENKLQDEVHTI